MLKVLGQWSGHCSLVLSLEPRVTVESSGMVQSSPTPWIGIVVVTVVLCCCMGLLRFAKAICGGVRFPALLGVVPGL